MRVWPALITPRNFVVMASNQQAEPRSIEVGSVMRDTESGKIGIVQRAPEGPYRL